MRALEQLRSQLGLPGMAGLALLALVAVLQALAVAPLQAARAELEQRLLVRGERGGGTRMDVNNAARLEAFYRHFQDGAGKDEWLAQLHAIAARSGVELKSADYRLQATGTRIERYEMVLPVSAGYAQLRTFLKDALKEIPVLSLDQVNLRKDSDKGREGRLQAEVRMTLHLLKPRET